MKTVETPLLGTIVTDSPALITVSYTLVLVSYTLMAVSYTLTVFTLLWQ